MIIINKERKDNCLDIKRKWFLHIVVGSLNENTTYCDLIIMRNSCGKIINRLISCKITPFYSSKLGLVAQLKID